MSAVYTEGPITSVVWEDVDYIHCTLEAPYKGGGLRFRLGTKDAKLNLDFVAGQERRFGPPYWPGAPIMYPEDAPAVKGSTWLMPASISSMIVGRGGKPIPNGGMHSGFTAFGFFMAPLLESPDIVGYTQTTERARVAAFWAGFKFPPDRENKGRPQPQMSRVGSPDVPDVSVRPLSKSMQPIKVDGVEVVIRVREFWNFNDPAQYEAPDALPQLPASDEVSELLKSMTDKEREFLLNMVRKGAASGKA